MNKEENWEKEFDKEMYGIAERDCDLYLVPNISRENQCWVITRKTEEIKLFISNLLHTQRQEIIRRIEFIKDCSDGEFLLNSYPIKDLLADLKGGEI